MTAPFLFCFGYESPAEFRLNAETGTDFESSTAFWIVSETESLALEWGGTVAERFIAWLFEGSNESAYSWLDAKFAHGIATDPGVIAAADDLPVASAGEVPPFALLVPRADAKGTLRSMG